MQAAEEEEEADGNSGKGERLEHGAHIPGLPAHALRSWIGCARASGQFVWQMRRTSRAVPWIFNKSTYTTGYNGSGSAYSPRFHRTMFGVLSHCLRLTVSSGTLEWIIRFGLEFPPEMAWPNKLI